MLRAIWLHITIFYQTYDFLIASDEERGWRRPVCGAKQWQNNTISGHSAGFCVQYEVHVYICTFWHFVAPKWRSSSKSFLVKDEDPFILRNQYNDSRWPGKWRIAKIYDITTTYWKNYKVFLPVSIWFISEITSWISLSSPDIFMWGSV